jgi:HTH-type transcriptional regulator/antitoxin HipB
MYQNLLLPDLANIVSYHRKNNHLTRLELAQRAGVGKTIIFDIEHGKQTIRLDTLVKILTALRISIGLEAPANEKAPELQSTLATEELIE